MNMQSKWLFLWVVTAMLATTTSCQSAQVEPIEYYYWVCQQGEYAEVVDIVYVRQGDAFYGYYVYAGEGVVIMGMIDKEGNLTGVSTALPDDEIFGTLSGKITGNQFNAIWSPSPSGVEFCGFQQMEMTLLEDVTEVDEDEFLADYDFTPETLYTPMAYGYHIGEWEERHISIKAGDKKGEVAFSLHIMEDGMDYIEVTIHGTATLNGNTFRYKEKNCEFEVAVYNGFITVKTISGTLDGFRVDGVYPAPNANG
jgi:hypothetical protein